MRVIFVLWLAAACSGASSARQIPSTSSAGAEPPLAEIFETRTRPPASPLEDRLAGAGVVFDPALDCVARAIAERAPMPPEPTRYRHVLSMRCGSPHYVLRAHLISNDDQAAAMVAALNIDFPSTTTIVVGIATVNGRRALVMARRAIELEPVSRRGGAVIRGRALVPATDGKLFVSTALGVKVTKFKFTDNAFVLDTQAPANADIEITMTYGLTTEPLGRFQLGTGSPLFRSDGSTMTRIAAARGVVGALPLERRGDPGGCKTIPVQVGGIDVSDKARCFDVPMLDLEGFADELAHRPQLQDIMLTRTASIMEIAEVPKGWITVRLLNRFEALAPEAARARALELLRQRWPALPERKVAGTGLTAVLDAWSKDPDAYNTASKYKPALDQVAAKWTTTKTYYDGLTAGRDLETTLDLITPDATPTSVDLAITQVRRSDGAMIHLVAVLLELP